VEAEEEAAESELEEKQDEEDEQEGCTGRTRKRLKRYPSQYGFNFDAGPSQDRCDGNKTGRAECGRATIRPLERSGKEKRETSRTVEQTNVGDRQQM